MILTKKRFHAALVAAFCAAAAAHAGFFDALAGALTWTAELAVLLAAKEPRLKELYLARYGPDGPAGTVHPTLTINADGAVTAVAIEKNSFGDDAFGADLAEEIHTWRMPETTWNMTLGFDLEFDPRRDLYGADVEVENNR